MDKIRGLNRIHQKLEACKLCPQMAGTPVHGPAIDTDILLIGQAPGAYESERGRPFAFTAGKTLFKWLYQATGLEEQEIREQVYFSAIGRCFPGKKLKGSGDREPSEEEIIACRPFLKAEVQVLKPKLIIAVGKLAIKEVLGENLFTKKSTLADVVGKKFEVTFHGEKTHVICLPHPSGVSTWPNTEPGKTLLKKALKLIEKEF